MKTFLIAFITVYLYIICEHSDQHLVSDHAIQELLLLCIYIS